MVQRYWFSVNLILSFKFRIYLITSKKGICQPKVSFVVVLYLKKNICFQRSSWLKLDMIYTFVFGAGLIVL